jgi:hypothetical protein
VALFFVWVAWVLVQVGETTFGWKFPSQNS